MPLPQPARRAAAAWLGQGPIAHRGLHELAAGIPENSQAAFKQALLVGCAIELDVHHLADGAVAVFHDDNLERLCSKPGRLADLDTAALRRHRLLGTPETIPLLVEVLATVAGQVPLLIELKNYGWPGRLEQAVAGLLSTYTGPVAVQSFNPLVVRWFARHAPALVRGQLAAHFVGTGMLGSIRARLGRYLLLAGLGRPDFLSYEAAALPTPAVARWRATGRPVLAWTVRSATEATRLQPALCDGIIFEGFRPIML